MGIPLRAGRLRCGADLAPRSWCRRSRGVQRGAGIGDVVVFVGLLALARFALALAALDTASNFGGMGASREVAFAALVEPALLLVLFAVALPARFDLALGDRRRWSIGRRPICSPSGRS